jgi:cell division septation protein DedD
MNSREMFVALALAIVAAPLSAQSVKAGIDAWQKGDFSSAVAIWRPLAEHGSADAQFNLGQAYRLGKGVPINLSQSQNWLERAADQGHVDAETTLGLMLFQNGDKDSGLKWLKMAADQDDPRAQLVYGTALFNGDGVTQNPVLGYALVARSAAKGLGPAKETLAQLDNLVSAQDRKKGMAVADVMAKRAGAGAVSSKKLAKAAPKASKRVEAKTAAAEPPKMAPQTAKPEPKPAPAVVRAAPVASSAPATGAWRIQLGAFSQRANAEGLYRKISGNGALSGRQPFYLAAGPVTRLQVGPFESKASAQSACSALHGQACFVVPAK